MSVIIQLSCRANFKAEIDFEGSKLWKFFWRFRDEAQEKYLTHFSPLKTKLPQLKSVLVLVHGYRAIFESLERKYTKIEKNLKDEYDLIVEYYWPASWEPVIGFAAASSRVNEAASRFYLAMKMLLQEYDASEIEHIVFSGHSLGCNLLLCQKDMKDMLGELSGKVRVALAAPAINYNDASDLEGIMFKNINDCRDLVVAYSLNDWVLKYAFRTAPDNWFSPAFFFKKDKWMVKLGALKTKVKWVDFTSIIGSSHGKYVDDPLYYNTVLRKGD